MSREYPCAYFENQRCTRFAKLGCVDWCVMGPCSYEVPSCADVIRSMSDEELAEAVLWLREHLDAEDITKLFCTPAAAAVMGCIDGAGDIHCSKERMKACALRWLKSPALCRVDIADVVDLDKQTKDNSAAMRKVIDFIKEERADESLCL